MFLKLALVRKDVSFLLLLQVVSAIGRMGFGERVRKNNQRAQALLKTQYEEMERIDAINLKKFRYLNNDTRSYRLKSLPDVPYDLGEIYSGLIPIDDNDLSRQLFFVFQPSIADPVDELTIWFNGGPGCSSLEGFLQENGRFLWQPGVLSPVENPYTWVNLTNMLWVEQPVGTGFSIGKPRARNEADVAEEFLGFLENFEKLFGIRKYKIYITGESYAGRYVPYVSAAMLDRKNRTYFDLQGALMYDPCIGSCDFVQGEVVAVPFIMANNHLLNFNDTYVTHLRKLHESCGYENYTNTYLSFPPIGLQPPTPAWNQKPSTGMPLYNAHCDVFDMATTAVFNQNPCFNIYDVNQNCPILYDPLGFPTSIAYLPAGNTVYFDRKDVKIAMHAPLNVTWAECSDINVFRQGDSSPDPIQNVLPQVIEATHRVLVSNGQWDMIVITNGTLLSIQNMTWNGLIGFQREPSTPIVIDIPDLQYPGYFEAYGYGGLDGPQGMMGTQHFERGLMWAETYQSGHMQPQYQPRVSYRHLEWLLGHIQAL